MICKHILLITFFNEPWLFFFFFTQLNYFYRIPIALFTINHLFTPNLNGFKYFYVIVMINVSHLFAHI